MQNIKRAIKINGRRFIKTDNDSSFFKDFINFTQINGFIYPSNEIYNGLAGVYDYGPLGVLLKRNLENSWRKFIRQTSQNLYEIQSSQIVSEQLLSSSGHLELFQDGMTTCKKCNLYYHKLIHSSWKSDDQKSICPSCCNAENNTSSFFNMLFSFKLGVSGNIIGYLRPETCQGM